MGGESCLLAVATTGTDSDTDHMSAVFPVGHAARPAGNCCARDHAAAAAAASRMPTTPAQAMTTPGSIRSAATPATSTPMPWAASSAVTASPNAWARRWSGTIRTNSALATIWYAEATPDAVHSANVTPRFGCHAQASSGTHAATARGPSSLRRAAGANRLIMSMPTTAPVGFAAMSRPAATDPAPMLLAYGTASPSTVM